MYIYIRMYVMGITCMHVTGNCIHANAHVYIFLKKIIFIFSVSRYEIIVPAANPTHFLTCVT